MTMRWDGPKGEEEMGEDQRDREVSEAANAR